MLAGLRQFGRSVQSSRKVNVTGGLGGRDGTGRLPYLNNATCELCPHQKGWIRVRMRLR